MNWSRVVNYIVLSVALLSLSGMAGWAWAIDETNVLVLYNADDDNPGDGTQGPGHQIADYYLSKYPGVHLVPLSGINAIRYGSTNEMVSATDYLNVIRPAVLGAISGISDPIDVIVRVA